MRKLVMSLVLVVAGLAGCASSRDLAIKRASREYDCPVGRIKKAKYIGRNPRGDTYQVHACGVVATYVCDPLHATCFKESDDQRDQARASADDDDE